MCGRRVWDILFVYREKDDGDARGHRIQYSILYYIVVIIYCAVREVYYIPFLHGADYKYTAVAVVDHQDVRYNRNSRKKKKGSLYMCQDNVGFDLSNHYTRR